MKKKTDESESPAEKKLSFFDFCNSINAGSRGPNLLEGSRADTSCEGKDPSDPSHAYNGFMINRSLSQFNDTVLLANEMNMHSGLPAKMQFDFLRHTVRARKRFSKWAKSAPDPKIIDSICVLYGYSKEKAREALSLFTPEQLQVIITKTEQGGKQ